MKNLWTMREHPNKASRFLWERLGMLIIAILATLLFCLISVLIRVNTANPSRLFLWLMFGGLVIYGVFLTWFVRCATIRTNALREFFLMDESGTLFFLNALRLSPNCAYPHSSSPLLFLIQDIRNTKRGLEALEPMLQSGQALAVALPIVSVTKIQKRRSGWKISCKVAGMGSRKSSVWIYIPLHAADAEQLCSILESRMV